ncbi:MAG TPA: Rieske 2Fe-2S domain-containing protein [Candidatus Acidoferrales bacterium]|nr:Rieske 2Fe-2S domain-containing protein [Candidatus Acidoferrales bacterium]
MGSPDKLEKFLEITRREFVSRGLAAGGWGAFAAVIGVGGFETVRFFHPRVLYLPPSTFRIGEPDAFVSGGNDSDAFGVMLVDDRWKSQHRFVVVREHERIYALSARCAHLGCTVNWFSDLHIFKCPCHGSEYHSNGVNFAGPAPRPLDRLRITLNLDGQLVVDTSITYGPDRYDVDGAFVRV